MTIGDLKWIKRCCLVLKTLITNIGLTLGFMLFVSILYLGTYLIFGPFERSKEEQEFYDKYISLPKLNVSPEEEKSFVQEKKES